MTSRLIFARSRERQRTGMRPRKTGENAKQGRLARTVRTAEFENFPTGKPERQPLEQDAQSARRREIFDLKDQ